MKVQVVLNLRESNNAQILIDADHYTTCMTGNAYFAAQEIVTQVNNTKTAVTALRTAINAPTSDTKTGNIKIARDVLDRNLTRLANKVEDVANDPAVADANRENIVHSAGMNTKTQVHPQKRAFTVNNTDISGTVYLTAQGGARAHEWQYTTDVKEFKNRESATTTTKGAIELEGLKRGTEYAFFHKAVVPDTKTEWEGPLLLIVT